MGLLDRFRPQTAPIGESGRNQTSGLLIEDDHNRELTGIQGIREFERMHRADADARKATRMVANPILAATWSVVPFGGDDAQEADREVAETVECLLMDHLGWSSHLATALDVALSVGHAPFETVWELVDYEDRKLWACCLDLRLPRSVHRFRQDDAGRLEAIEQLTRRGGMRTIPAEQLVFYRLGARGDNWRGESLLRPAYKNFAYKEKLEHIGAMAAERFAMGTPVGYPPAGADDSARAALAEILANMRAGESGYIVSPWPHAQFAAPGQGAIIEIVQPSGESFDIEPLLKYHSDKIAAAVLQEFMRLGQSGVGARATADVQQDPFLAFCEVLCSVLVEDTINDQLIPRLVALNFPQAAGLPRLRASLIDRTSVSELADAAGKLTTAGLLHPDALTEDWMRDYLGMPAADPVERAAREQAADAAREALAGAGPAAPAGPEQDPEGEDPEGEDPEGEDPEGEDPEDHGAPPTGLRMLRRQDRPLRWWENAIQLDRIEGAIDSARDRLIAACQPITHELAVRIAERPDAKRPPDTSDLAAAIVAELGALYWTGRDTVSQELDAQRTTGAADRPMHFAAPAAWDGRFVLAEPQTPENLKATGRLAADNIAGRMVAAVKAHVLSRSRSTQAALQVAAEGAARGAIREEATRTAAAALGQGRADQADEQSGEIRGARYTSVLDGRRCPACAAADDDILRPLDDPVRLERVPPNPDCQGGDACRCVEFFELMDEAPPSA